MGAGWEGCKGHVRVSGGYYVGNWFNTLSTNSLVRGIQNNDFTTNGNNLRSNITFDGLTAGTSVKIFTIAGEWVATLEAPGRSVDWLLKNNSGDPVASGLYLYLITDSQGNKTRGKIGIIR